MLIKCGVINIDTESDVKAHKEVIASLGENIHCERNSPEIWFCGKNKLGTNTYYELHYNENGSKLKKIRTWDVNPKYDGTGCYFEQKSIEISINRRILWNRHWWN